MSVQPAPERHLCDIPAPNYYLLGTTAVCGECGRKWVLGRHGFTFKQWRPTLWSRFRRGRARHSWATVYRTPQD